MPLSWNEIRDRARSFSKEWEGESSESAEAQTFWNEFFTIFGVDRRRVARFEVPVKKETGDGGSIDLLWKGLLLVEHKSAGKDLDRAFHQATDYFPGLKDRDLPAYVAVSDFARIRLYDLTDGEQHEFPLADLHRQVRLFGFIAGYQSREFGVEDPVNVKVVRRLGELHRQLDDAGYDGHYLEVLLVRLLFCMFAEDTGVFERRQFQDYLEQRTSEDGSDVGMHLGALFDVLNFPFDKRMKTLDEQLGAFKYVDGGLYTERLPLTSFNRAMRETLLECCALDWSRISPAIFGSLFQNVMTVDPRHLGQHYTSEANIMKALGPLFLDGLREELRDVKRNPARMPDFHAKLSRIRVLDPACGCGNFLVVAYRELRLIELDLLREMHKGQHLLDVSQFGSRIDVDAFYGIEIEDFPAQVARVAMWLTDHQMNMRLSEEFGHYYARLPLYKTPVIIHANSIRLDWKLVCKPSDLYYIVGNPPFVGGKFMDDEQKEDRGLVFGDLKNLGLLDYVTCWYGRAAEYMQANPTIRTAFVSTNSITQGEQVGVLWPYLLAKGVHINFAHRTFQWSSEARKAAVHCVIVGFSLDDNNDKRLFDYDTVTGEPHESTVKRINPYLVDGPDVVVTNRGKPICAVPEMGIGNKPIDDGNYLFTPEEKRDFLAQEPEAKAFFRRWMGGDEFLNGIERWCLWLGDCPPDKLRKMPESLKRVELVREFRKASKSAGTQALADRPTRFHVENMPESEFLVVPKVCSERRQHIPIGYLGSDALASDLLYVLRDSTLFHFGILQSLMHMAWVRTVCGRLESRFRYSSGIVYNNFPWPENPDAERVKAVEASAKNVLDVRKEFRKSTLADLYDPITMPSDVLNAHRALDRAVDACYGRTRFANERARVEFLFDLYGKYTAAPASSAKPPKSRKPR